MNKLLVVGSSKSGKLTLIKALFGSLPQVSTSSHQGLIHKADIKTRYYETGIDVWIDEPTDFKEWSDVFRSQQAQEIRDALSGIILTVDLQIGQAEIINQMDQVSNLVRLLTREQNKQDPTQIMWNGIALVVIMNRENLESIEIEDYEELEVVRFDEVGKNQYGELCGLQRIREAIEAHDWEIDTESQPIGGATKNNESEVEETTEDIEQLIDLSAILSKLKLAKDEINKMDSMEDKSQYANQIIKDLNLF